jgi:hypothetical protein
MTSQIRLSQDGFKNAHGCAYNAENSFGFTFLEQYQKDGDGFLHDIITGDETWVSSVNVETKQQSKQWMQSGTGKGS